jgi:hypothetical protein
VLLLRLAFLEGANRANTIFSRIPPARVWVFSEGSGATAYAWFVWDKEAPGTTELKWFCDKGADTVTRHNAITSHV